MSQIEEKLNSEFRGEGRRLVFWYDDKGDFAGDVSFVDYNKVREWSNEELTVIRAVTNVVSSYLLKMKAYEDASNTVERLTGYDSVTGLLMYEKFLSLTAEYIENAPHGRYAFIYMDFSNFKYVNETYGYETGDSILKNLADELQLQSAFFIYGSRVFSDNIVVFAKVGDMTDEELVKYIEQQGKNFSDRVQMQYIDSKLYPMPMSHVREPSFRIAHELLSTVKRWVRSLGVRLRMQAIWRMHSAIMNS